jgi:phenylpropionate dioxygenase-like ring-hydroxylating dioxygenase large terminal subunit
MKEEQNQLITQVGAGTACGAVLRQYWQPVALVEEFDPKLYPSMQLRPLKSVRLLGEDLVLFRDADGSWGLMDRACPHRGADLSFGRLDSLEEGGGLRCPFHGWKFAPDGRCLDTPAEPVGSKLCERVSQRSYPVIAQNGVVMAWLGPKETVPPPLPALDCFRAPASHSFAFKGLWNANWLQAFEVGIDPAHTSYLHRFLNDEDLGTVGANAAGKQFRSASAGDVQGERWPMTRIMREFGKPDIRFNAKPWGFQLQTLRQISAERTHVRVTNGLFACEIKCISGEKGESRLFSEMISLFMSARACGMEAARFAFSTNSRSLWPMMRRKCPLGAGLSNSEARSHSAPAFWQ